MPFDENHGGGGGGGGYDRRHDSDLFDKLAHSLGLNAAKAAQSHDFCVDCFIRRLASLMVSQLAFSHVIHDRGAASLFAKDRTPAAFSVTLDELDEELLSLFSLMRVQVVHDAAALGLLDEGQAK